MREVFMPRGAYTAKQDRKEKHIEESYEKRGVSHNEAERRAWATVNKQDKGGKNSGSGRSSSRSAAAKKGWETRRRHGNG
jgi:plasmid stabilization system protein ParE